MYQKVSQQQNKDSKNKVDLTHSVYLHTFSVFTHIHFIYTHSVYLHTFSIFTHIQYIYTHSVYLHTFSIFTILDCSASYVLPFCLSYSRWLDGDFPCVSGITGRLLSLDLRLGPFNSCAERLELRFSFCACVTLVQANLRTHILVDFRPFFFSGS